jgi:hypothetical protein
MEGDPIEGYYLLRVFDPRFRMCDSVFRLPREEAIAACSAFDPTRGFGGGDTHGYRDQTEYYEKRIEAERWLREMAQGQNVRIDDPHPVYFALTKDPETVSAAMQQRYPSGVVRLFPANSVDLANWSFTSSDSILTHSGAAGFISPSDAGGSLSPPPQRIMNVKDIVMEIRNSGKPVEAEAQLWAKDITSSGNRHDRSIKAGRGGVSGLALSLMFNWMMGAFTGDSPDKPGTDISADASLSVTRSRPQNELKP